MTNPNKTRNCPHFQLLQCIYSILFSVSFAISATPATYAAEPTTSSNSSSPADELTTSSLSSSTLATSSLSASPLTTSLLSTSPLISGLRSYTFSTPSGAQTIQYRMIGDIPVIQGDVQINLNKPEKIIGYYPYTAPVTATKSQTSFGTSVSALSAITDPSLLWPQAEIVYHIDSSVSNDLRQAIMDTILHFELRTPIRFIPYTDQDDYVMFREAILPDGVGGTSYIGRQGGSQTINLAAHANLNITAHEIGHALGLIHEHNRNDRDDFIIVHWHNIPRDNRDRYEKYTNSAFKRGAYDYDSVMHYETTGGIHPNLTKKDGSYITKNIVFPSGLSAMDQEEIRKLYCPLVNQAPSRCTPYNPPSSLPIFYPDMVVEVSGSFDFGLVQPNQDYANSHAVTIRNRMSEYMSTFYSLGPLDIIENKFLFFDWSTNEISILHLNQFQSAQVVVTSTDPSVIVVAHPGETLEYNSPPVPLIMPAQPSNGILPVANFKSGTGPNGNQIFYDSDGDPQQQIFVLGPNESLDFGIILKGAGVATSGPTISRTIKIDVIGFGREGNIEHNGEWVLARKSLFRTITAHIPNPQLHTLPSRLVFYSPTLSTGGIPTSGELAKTATQLSFTPEFSTGPRVIAPQCTAQDRVGLGTSPNQKAFIAENAGTTTLTITNMQIESTLSTGAFQIKCLDSNQVPLSIPSGGSVYGVIEFNPINMTQDHFARLLIESSSSSESVDLMGFLTP